jgi:hypothetical protein
MICLSPNIINHSRSSGIKRFNLNMRRYHLASIS